MLRNTLDGIEALAALAQFRTVSEAATRLRLTQSAVTKRLQSLQRSVDFPLLEHSGRRLTLTDEACVLLERARPLLADLRALTVPSAAQSASTFSLAMSDSIAASWGPQVVARALTDAGRVQLELHVHRSILVIENVRLGRYQVGLVTDVPAQKDLIHYPVIAEPMVLVRADGGGRGRRGMPLITIEPMSLTWRAIEPLIRARHPELLERRLTRVESFSAAVQMTKAGFGDALVPLGLVREMKVRSRSIRVLTQIERHVTLLTRKTVNQNEGFRRLRDALQAAARRHFEAAG
jgi:DNA-binding transcriptional LysR family regulator